MDKKHIILLALIVLLAYFTMSSKTRYESEINVLNTSLSKEMNEVIRLKSNLNQYESKVLDLEYKLKQYKLSVKKEEVEYFENGNVKKKVSFDKKESNEDKIINDKKIELKDLSVSQDLDKKSDMKQNEVREMKKSKTFYESAKSNWFFILLGSGLLYYQLKK
jgi:hypothetical protein